jgi:ATPase subunit of ABC transporter with duplicated ATPase domains
MRAGLSVSLPAKNPPQLLILDETTNYLDLKSIHTIESALAAYKGALIIVSQYECFLGSIGVEKILLC